MPRLRVIPRRATPGIVQAPRISPENFGAGAFRALGQAAQTLGDIGDRMQAAQDRIDLARIRDEYNAGIKEDRLALEANPDFLNHGEIFGELQKQRIEEALAKTDRPDVQNALQESINQNLLSIRVDVEAHGMELMGQKQLGDLAAAETRLLDDAARLTDDQRQVRLQDYNEQIDALVGTGTGQLDSRAGQKLKDSFRKRMEDRTVAAIEDRIIENPALVRGELNAGIYDDLPLGTVNALKKTADSQVSANRVKFNAEEKRRIEIVNSELLEAFDAKDLTFEAVQKQNLPFDDKRKWRTMLQKQAKNENPFLVSVPETHALVFTSIVNEPEKWTVARITNLVGNGLSSVDGIKAVRLMKAMIKGDPNNPTKFRPLQQVMATINRLRSDTVFVPDVESGDALTPQQLFDNELKAQEVRETVLLAQEQGQDPFVALQQAMKPFLQERTNSYWDAILNFGRGVLSISREISVLGRIEDATAVTAEQEQDRDILELEARRWLQQRNTPATPNNLKRTMNHLRR